MDSNEWVDVVTLLKIIKDSIRLVLPAPSVVWEAEPTPKKEKTDRIATPSRYGMRAPAKHFKGKYYVSKRIAEDMVQSILATSSVWYGDFVMSLEQHSMNGNALCVAVSGHAAPKNHCEGIILATRNGRIVQALNAWCICAKRVAPGIPREIRRLISQLVWNDRSNDELLWLQCSM